MPNPLLLSEIYKRTLVQALKLTPGTQAKRILGIIGEGNLSSSKDLPESLRNRYFDNTKNQLTDNENTSFEAIKQTKNDIYQEPKVIYQTNIINNIYQNIPKKPSPLLPVKEGLENNNQTPTAVVIGAPITLAESLANQSFGKLLYSPFTTEKLKIRQVNQSDSSKKLAELNEAGLDNFSKYLAKDESANALDAVCLFVPSVIRGLSGETTVLFGRDPIKFLLSAFTSSSVNALIGATSVVHSGYEIEHYTPEFSEDTEVVDGISLQSISDILGQQIEGIVEIGDCTEPGENSKGYSEYLRNAKKDISYSGIGLAGIHEALKATEKKLTAMHQDICAAIDPAIDIPTFVPHVCTKPEDEDGEKEDQEPDQKKDSLLASIADDFGDIAQDKIGDFIDFAKDSSLVWLIGKVAKVGGWKAVAAQWFISYMAESLFRQQEQVSQVMCNTSHLLEEVKELIEQIDPVTAVPEIQQVRVGSDRPSLVLVLKQVDANSYWSLTIPHYVGGTSRIERLRNFSFTKGSVVTKFVMNDNSKIIINAKDSKSGESLINFLLRSNLLDKKFTKNAQLTLAGTRKGEELKSAKVQPHSAKWFPYGVTNNKPEWTYLFKDD